MTEPKKVVLFAREVSPREPDREPSLYLPDKWANLDQALETDTDVVAIAFPEVLGDQFTELIVNLGKIADSGKSLRIIKPSPFLKLDSVTDV